MSALRSFMEQTAKHITLYTSETCNWCRLLKQYLDERNITYTDNNISDNIEKMEEAEKVSGQTAVPITHIKDGDNETIIVGFDQEKLDKALA